LVPDVVSIGELLIDFVSTRKGVALADSPGFEKKPGGAPANVAVGLARLGLRSGFVAALLSELLAEVHQPGDIEELPPSRLSGMCDFANAVGALTCTKVGAIPALPTREEALRFWHERRQ
jgi:sugar/nucleoside kinase (ribokinase family)